jgi:hypothetical protein
MARIDHDAADLIRRLLVNNGFNSPEQFATAVRDKAIAAGLPASKVSVSGDTIRLILKTGREPGGRVKFAIAFGFDRKPGHIWRRDAVFLNDQVPA